MASQETVNQRHIEKAKNRYRNETVELASCGFDYLGCYDDVGGPFSWLQNYSIVQSMKKDEEVIGYRFPLGYTTTNPVFMNPKLPAYSYALGLGVNFYTFFSNRLLIVTSSFGGSHLNREIPDLYYKYRVAGPISDAWIFHKDVVERQISEGHTPNMDMTLQNFMFIDYVDTQCMLLDLG
jgi:hypothetical protein